MIMKLFLVVLIGYGLGFVAVAIARAAHTWGQVAAGAVIRDALEQALIWPTLLLT